MADPPRLNGNALLLKLALGAVVVLFGILQGVTMSWVNSSNRDLLDARSRLLTLENREDERKQDHDLLRSVANDWNRRQAQLADLGELMKEIRGALVDLNTRYTALQVDIVRLQMQSQQTLPSRR